MPRGSLFFLLPGVQVFRWSLFCLLPNGLRRRVSLSSTIAQSPYFFAGRYLTSKDLNSPQIVSNLNRASLRLRQLFILCTTIRENRLQVEPM